MPQLDLSRSTVTFGPTTTLYLFQRIRIGGSYPYFLHTLRVADEFADFVIDVDVGDSLADYIDAMEPEMIFGTASYREFRRFRALLKIPQSYASKGTLRKTLGQTIFEDRQLYRTEFYYRTINDLSVSTMLADDCIEQRDDKLHAWINQHRKPLETCGGFTLLQVKFTEGEVGLPIVDADSAELLERQLG